MLTPLISSDVAARVLKLLNSTKFEVEFFSSQSFGLLVSLLDLNKISLELANYLEQSMGYLTAVYNSPTMLVKFKRYNSLINDTAASLGLNHQGEAEFYITLHAKLACRGIILDSRFKLVKHNGHEFAFFYIHEVFTVTSSVESKFSNLNLKEIIYLVTPGSDKIENSALGYAVSSTHDSIFCNLRIIRQKFQRFSDHVRWFTHFEDPGILFPTIFDVLDTA